MAKVSGPLMSMEASGAYGSTLVFGKRKGSNVVRQLVTPSNPQSQGQEDARNIVRVGGTLQKFVSATTLKRSGETDTDKLRLAAKAPSNQTWNSYLVQLVSGKGGLTFSAARTAYAALTAPQKTAWETAAAALTPVIGSSYQTTAGGGASTPLTGGEAWFVYNYGLATVGLASQPTGTPPTYA
jgi:hypothetical protein